MPMCAAWPYPTPPPYPAHYPDADVQTKLLRCCLHANPLPLSASLHACARACTLTLFDHSRALATTPSCPVGPGAHNYKRGPSRSFCLCTNLCLPPVSRHHHTASVFRCSVGAKPSHPTSLPVRKSQSFVGSQSCSQTSSSHFFSTVSSDAVDRIGELHPSIARLPRFERDLSTISGGFAVRLG
jgi:hypothetical protein